MGINPTAMKPQAGKVEQAGKGQQGQKPEEAGGKDQNSIFNKKEADKADAKGDNKKAEDGGDIEELLKMLLEALGLGGDNKKAQQGGGGEATQGGGGGEAPQDGGGEAPQGDVLKEILNQFFDSVQKSKEPSDTEKSQSKDNASEQKKAGDTNNTFNFQDNREIINNKKAEDTNPKAAPEKATSKPTPKKSKAA